MKGELATCKLSLEQRARWLNAVQELGHELLQECSRHPAQVYPTWENFPVKAMLMVCEVAEAVEAHRCAFVKQGVDVGPNEDECRSRAKARIAQELADVLIYVVQTAAGLGLDLGEAVLQKVEENWKRPVMHGGKSY